MWRQRDLVSFALVRSSWLDCPQYLLFAVPVTCVFYVSALAPTIWHLYVELGRWHDRQPRDLRICHRCNMHQVDDEC